MTDPLVERLKLIIINTLKIEDIGPESIKADAPLRECGVEFDSIDSLELSVQLEKEFGIKVSSNEGAKIAYGSVAELAQYLREKAAPEKLLS